jgi:hypothetical protein
MTATQLELNLQSDSEDLKFCLVQNQIDAINDSMGKVRRKLFSELGEIKKMFFELKKENEFLKAEVKSLKNETTEWNYGTGDCLFDVRECAQRAG